MEGVWGGSECKPTWIVISLSALVFQVNLTHRMTFSSWTPLTTASPFAGSQVSMAVWNSLSVFATNPQRHGATSTLMFPHPCQPCLPLQVTCALCVHIGEGECFIFVGVSECVCVPPLSLSLSLSASVWLSVVVSLCFGLSLFLCVCVGVSIPGIQNLHI